jgi:hypothetical protein
MYVILAALKNRIAHAVTAPVAVQRSPRRKESGAPDIFIIADIEAAAAIICRYIIITEAGNPAKLGILIKTVTAAGIADQ